MKTLRQNPDKTRTEQGQNNEAEKTPGFQPDVFLKNKGEQAITTGIRLKLMQVGLSRCNILINKKIYISRNPIAD